MLWLRRLLSRNRLRTERTVEAWLGKWIESFWVDLRYAGRILHKSPGFTAIAVASLALAIGANTTIFSYANQVLFVRLGVPHPEQLRVFRLTGDEHIAVREIKGYDVYVSDDGHVHLGLFPYPTYQQLRRNNRVVEDIFAFVRPPDVDITAAGTPEVGKVEFVSGNFYTQMQVKPQLGRPIEPAETALHAEALLPSSATASGIVTSAERMA
ncbi:MAG: efflux pump, inner rane subunit [Gammaproteobacteria bacterium]|nr:efflux pump, inner rane subunit [Gammaproteobacteria bacterium]